MRNRRQTAFHVLSVRARVSAIGPCPVSSNHLSLCGWRRFSTVIKWWMGSSLEHVISLQRQTAGPSFNANSPPPPPPPIDTKLDLSVKQGVDVIGDSTLCEGRTVAFVTLTGCLRGSGRSTRGSHGAAIEIGAKRKRPYRPLFPSVCFSLI